MYLYIKSAEGKIYIYIMESRKSVTLRNGMYTYLRDFMWDWYVIFSGERWWSLYFCS